MGLFSNLLGGKKPDSPLLDKLLDVLDKTAEQAQQNASAGEPETAQPAEPTAEAAPAQNLSGLPWGGDVPPAEENSFTFRGTYLEYFEYVFRAEFPEYTLDIEQYNNGKRAVIRFMKDGSCALVTELLNDSASVFKLRRDTLRAGIPYLRYYYGHEGWWNTRSYVTERTRAALNR
ncbi:MAG: hypothetical protein J6Z45_01990 [Oscillospiraceae bacterium]|nr:hypothetical protein [Oscillospiraceae bacterium]